MRANKLPWLGWLFIVSWLSATTSSANAQPITPAPDGTNTLVTPNGNRYDISGGSFSGDKANLFHSFTEFGLSQGQIANFLTNPNIQNILGRINGGNPSLINGLIQVTGGNSNLFLMNPSGIIFGRNASLNVPGSFNANTATGISFGNNNWFSAIGSNNWITLVGTPNTFAFTNLQPGTIVNAGNLTVPLGQSLTLMGGNVVNTGQLTAPSGNITIAAVPGQNLVRIAQSGNLLSLEVQPTASQSSLPNNLTQPVLSLPQLLTGKGVEQATGFVVNPNGEVVLTGNVGVAVAEGTAIASGALNVSGNTGGTVNILGEKVGVIGGAIDAFGINGGGTVLVGGDYQGLGTVPNAARTFVSGDSTINADAVSNGNGGKVIVWADETTRFKGNISARGGLVSGDGGFVEVSGKQSLDFQGAVDLRSTFGIAGTLLLDPTDITIDANVDAGGTLGGIFTPAADTSTINNVTLQNQLALGSVTISTASGFTKLGNITVNAKIAWNNKNSLTLNANNNITVDNSIITTPGGNVTLNADSDNSNGGRLQILNSTIETNGGNFLGNGQAIIGDGLGINVQKSTIDAGAGKIDLKGIGGNSTGQNIGILTDNSTLKTIGSGNITLDGTGGNVTGFPPGNTGISLTKQSQVTSVDGTIKLIGQGGNNGNDNNGINIDASNVESTGTGSITFNGTGGNGIDNNTGININLSTVKLAGGNITFNGTGGNGINKNQGISIQDSKVQLAGGNISLTGTGSGTGVGNNGVIINNTIVESTANGTVTITGTGGANSAGINISDNFGGEGIVRSQNGDINLTGTGGKGDNNTGITIAGLVESTDTGKVTLTGFGGNGLNNNQGININFPGNVLSVNGDINLTGTSNGSGKGNTGILIDGVVESKDTGKVNLIGVGGNGTDNNQGISINNVPVSTVRSQTGDITLTGTGNGSGTGNTGITIVGQVSTGIGTGIGNVTITGKGANNANAIVINGFINQVDKGNNVTLTGDEIQVLGLASQVNGKDTITLQPLTPSLDITIGGTKNDANDPPLNLIQEELDTLKGFSNIVIGRTDGTGAIAIDPAGVTFNFPVTIQSSTIAVNGNITGKNNASITFNASTTNLKANILTNEQKINFAGNVSLDPGSNVKLDTGLTDAGDINFGGKVDGDGNLVLTTGTGVINLNGSIGRDVPLRSLTTVNPLKVNSLNEFEITTQNNITIGDTTNSGGAIALTSQNGDIDTSKRVIDTTSTTGNGGKITLTANNIKAGNLNSSSTVGNGGDITLTSKTGDINTSVGTINTQSSTGNGGLITLISANNIITGKLDSSSISGVGGNINFTGTGDIDASAGAIETKSNTGNGGQITLSGNNITASNLNSSSIDGNGGNITLTGKTGDIIAAPIPAPEVVVWNSSSTSGAAGDITIATPNQVGVNSIDAKGLPGTGNIKISGNEIGFLGVADSVKSQGTLSIQPSSPNVGIRFQKGLPDDPQAIDLGQQFLDSLRDGFSGIAFGGDTTTGNITVENLPIVFKDPVTFNTQGKISVNPKQSISGIDNASITLNAPTNKLNGNITTESQNITINGDAIVENDVLVSTGKSAGGDILFKNNIDGSGNLTLETGTATIDVQGAIGNTTALGNIIVNSAGTTTFSQTVNAQSLTTDAGGTTKLNGNVTTTGNQTYGDAVTLPGKLTATQGDITFQSPVTLQNKVAIDTSAGTGKIVFNKTVEGTTANSQDLTLTAGTGDITFTGAVGTSTIPLGAIATNSSGTTSFASTVDAQSLTTNGGTTKLNDNVTTTGTQNYQNPATISGKLTSTQGDINFQSPVTLQNKVAIDTSAGNGKIVFNNTVDGTTANSQDLTLNAGTGDITVNGAIGNNKELGNLIVNSGGKTTLNDVKANTLSTDRPGTTQLNGNVTTTGNQTYADAVTIGNNPTLTGNGITFDNTVDGNSNLTVNGGTGNITFSEAIGQNTPLNNLTVNSPISLGVNVTTNGSQTYTDAVTIANNSILTGNGISFNKTVDGNSDGKSDLTLNAGTGKITVDGAIGKTFPLNSLTANSPISLGGDVSTTGTQTYADAVIIANNLTLAGNGITFNKTVDGNSDLTVNGGSSELTFTGAIDLRNIIANTAGKTTFNAVTANSLTTDAGGITQLNSSLITTSNQTYGDAVTIANNPTLTGSDITFNSTVDGNSALTVNNNGNLNITKNLSIDGAFTQTGTGSVALSGNLTTNNNNISFNGPVTLNAPVSFNLGNAKIAFGSTLSAGDNPLNLTAGEIDFSGQVSGTNALTLQPATPGQNITVGGIDNNTSALDLTASEINQIQNGFSSIAIGSSTSSGKINIPNILTFFDPVTIQAGTGSIALNGTLTGSDNSSIALNASTINLNSGINTTNNNIAINGKVQIGNDVTLASGGGNVSVTGTIDGARRLNIDAGKGNVLLPGNIGQTTALSGLNVTASNTNLGGNVTTNQGEIIINSALGLTNDATLSTSGGNIFFGGAIDNNNINPRNLTLDSGSGSITFNGSVGATSKLGNILIQNAGNVTGNSTINAQQLTAANTQQVKLSGDVTAGKVDLTAKGDITVKNITTNGGETLFISGNVFTSGNLNTSGNIGGNITVKAITSITAGQINSSGIVGNAGNVFLDPIGDIQVEFINAQGGTSGSGGDVTAVTGNFFRATGSFATPLSPTGFASISTAGGTGGGNISITHAGGDGGPPIQPFVVGDAAINGTAAAITTGDSIIRSQSFPGSDTVGNIAIVTDDATPITPTPTPITPTPTPITPTPTPITPTPTPITPTPTPITPTPTPITPTPTPITPTPTPITPTPTPITPTPTPITPTPTPITPTPTPITPTPTPITPTPTPITPTPTPITPTPTSITPTPTPITPTPTPTPTSRLSTPEPEDFQRRKIPPLDNPGEAADRILTIDRAIISKLPARIAATLPPPKQSRISNPPSNVVLGYFPPPDRLFEENNIESTIWGIEQIRNQEFGSHLGVKANLPEQKIIISKFQQNLRTIEQETGKRSGIIYIVSRVDRLELILVPPVGTPIHYSVPEANRAALGPVVDKFINEVTDKNKLRTTSYLASAKQLYQWAIAPLEKDLERLGIHTLLLSVDPGLRSVPFAALHDGKGFLIQKYNFSLIPSFSLTDREYKSVRGATVLAMGRSEFVEQEPLPSVPIELQTITSQWRGQSFLNSAFTLDNLNSQHAQRGFRIVHLATHAEFQAGKPSESYIQLWNTKLQLDRMESLNWRNPQVDLLVLSACRTALGDRESELGFGGLAVKSGAKSALGSLWYVDDGGTLGLMTEFYQQLQGSTIKSEALQLAQQAMISRKVRLENGQLVTTGGKLNLPANSQQEKQNFSHPYYWSSFTTIGNPW